MIPTENGHSPHLSHSLQDPSTSAGPGTQQVQNPEPPLLSPTLTLQPRGPFGSSCPQAPASGSPSGPHCCLFVSASLFICLLIMSLLPGLWFNKPGLGCFTQCPAWQWHLVNT